MSPKEFNALHIVHVSAVLILIGLTFFAFAAAPETRKRVLMGAGLASLAVFLTGLRMWQAELNFVMAGWILVKILCWLGISAFSGVAYRRREYTGFFAWATVFLAVTAVAMVYVKPF